MVQALFDNLDNTVHGLAYVPLLECICLYNLSDGLVGSPPQKLLMNTLQSAREAENYFSKSYYVNNVSQNYFNHVIVDVLCHDDAEGSYGKHLMRHSFALFGDIMHPQMNRILEKMENHPEQMLKFMSQNSKDFLSINSGYLKETIALLKKKSSVEDVATHMAQYLFKQKGTMMSTYAQKVQQIILQEFPDHLELFLSLDGIYDYLEFKKKSSEKQQIFKTMNESRTLHLEINIQNLFYHTMIEGYSSENYNQMLKMLFSKIKMTEAVKDKDMGVKESYCLLSATATTDILNVFVKVNEHSFLDEKLLQDYIMDFIDDYKKKELKSFFGVDTNNWINKYWLHKKLSLVTSADDEKTENIFAEKSFKL